MSCIIGITSTVFSCVASEGRTLVGGNPNGDNFNKTFIMFDKNNRKYLGAHCGSTVVFGIENGVEKISDSIINIFRDIEEDKFEDVICIFKDKFKERINQATECISDKKIDLIIIGPNREMFRAIFKAESDTVINMTECEIIKPTLNHFCCYTVDDGVRGKVMAFLSNYNSFNCNIANEAIQIAIKESPIACNGTIFVLPL